MNTLLKKIRDNDILLEMVDGKLKIFASGSLNAELVAEIKEKKNELIQFLQQNGQAGFKSTFKANIPVISSQSYYPLSASQHRLWLLSQLNGGNVAYNIPAAYVFKGNLHVEALTYAFKVLLQRHESLRTVFKEDEQGEIRQFIQTYEETGFCIEQLDVRMETEEKVNAMIETAFTHNFDLAKGCLIRTGLYQTKDHEWIFVCVMPHIISDGWSMSVLIRELLQFYNTYIAGDPNPLVPLRIQYKDYVAWWQSRLNNELSQEHRAYWLKQFEGELPVLDLPGGKTRPVTKTYNGASINKWIDPAICKPLDALCAEQGSTLFMGLLAAVTALLHRYTGQEDIITGTPVAGRDHEELENQIGLYINTLTLRTACKGENNFKELLQHIRQITLEAYEHQMYPFDELVSALNGSRDMSRNPLFDVMVVLQNAGSDILKKKRQMGDVQVNWYERANTRISKFDISFIFEELDDRILLNLEYNTDIYDHAMMVQLADHLLQLLTVVTTQPLTPIGQLDYLSKEEKQTLLQAFNDTSVKYNKYQTVIGLFEEQVVQTPDNIAVVFDDITLTYALLNETSNQFARYLRQNNTIQPDNLIAVMLDRNEWMIIVILGILKAGAAYVPVDPDYPQERIDYILQDSGCKILVDEATLQKFKKEQTFYSTANIEPINKPGDLAYVIYTSGSTGKPKGVMIEHRNVNAFIHWCAAEFEHAVYDVVFAVTSICFDLSVFEIFHPIITGKKLRVLKNALSIPQHLHTKETILLNTVPSVVGALLDAKADLSAVSVLNMAGEPVPQKYISALDGEKMEIRNLYGPSEDTTYSTVYRIKNDRELLIGRPISNTQVYILNEYRQLQPVGVTGEICLAGDGLARGYLNNEVLTNEKFIANPFKQNDRLYCTGDTGRWLPDGNIEYTGRKDDQVKIRGYRIELGEIEHALQNIPGITSATVIARAGSDAGKTLVAYLVSKLPMNSPAIREQLHASLPAYMLPDHFVQLQELPITPNGKIDKRKLQALEVVGMETGFEYVAPRNEMEKKLVNIWQELLGRDKISIKDNFFHVGGHSLKITRLASKIYKEFEVKISFPDLFAKPVLEEQALLIRQASTTAYSGIPVACLQESYALSSAQRRLWVLSQLQDGNVAYNMPRVYVFEGDLNIAALEYAFKALIARHEILRTVFRENDEGTINQYIQPQEACFFKIVYSDLRNEVEKREKIKTIVQEQCIQPFDLIDGPLLRAAIYQQEDNKWIFIYVMHHIISDGWSMNVLTNELMLFYKTYVEGKEPPLAPLAVQYKDYSTWQQQQLGGVALMAHKQYWLNKFDGDLPVLELPADKTRPAVKTYNGSIVNKEIDVDLSNGLNILCHKQGCTLFMGLLAVVNALLYRYTGQEDIIIGSPIAGREHPDLENQIGFYVNTLALRMQFDGGNNFAELLKNSQQITLEAFEHQAYPFDELVNALELQRDLSRNPLFDVMIVLQNMDITQIEGNGPVEALTIRKYDELKSTESKFDLLFTFVENGEALQMNVSYNDDIFNEDNIERLVAHFEQLLAVIIQAPLTPIGELDYLNADEKQQLLIEFNDTFVDYPLHKTIIDLLQKQVVKTPHRTALVFEEKTYSYEELNELCNRFGRYIASKSPVEAGECIAVLLHRSEWSVISMIAIMKLGCTYVPIDSSLPVSRIEYILKESKSKIVIADNRPAYTEGITIIETGKLPDDMDAADINCPIDGTDASFIIYTSGSTGNPKGVEQTHLTLYNLILWDINGAKMHTGTKHLQFSSFGFDSSLHDIYYALCTGGEVHVINEHLRLDLWALKDYVIDKKITTLSMPYAALKAMFSEIPAEEFAGHSIDEIISTGEQLYVSGGLRSFLKNNPAITIHNLYGPSETHVVTGVSYSFSTGDIPEKAVIGKPVHNTVIYILDKAMQPVPVGIEGEIYIGGWNLAKGYKDRPDLTAERFIDNPFMPGQILYRSGDIGKWLPNGDIEYMMRKDNQVKINGYRIELEEIERCLRTLDNIEEALVIVKDLVAGDKMLVAYVVSKIELITTDIRNYLSKHLPAYMQPAWYIQLDKLPLTPNGKVDKRALPVPEVNGMKTGVEYVAPRNPIESKLVDIWSDILAVDKEKIGVHHNFFGLGGHSLKATRLVSMIHKEFEVKLPLRDLFIQATIEEISTVINTLLWVKNTDTIKLVDKDMESLVF